MRSEEKPHWRPEASLATLKARAQLYASIRTFLAAHGVLEVETPILSAHATVDRHIESFVTSDGRWLQTSPEFAMKRLLCAGAGAIFQIARVFRREEAGRLHNPEFSLLEWYRPGFDHHRLMDEVELLMRAVCVLPDEAFERLSYRAAFERHGGFDPFETPLDRILRLSQERGLAIPEPLTEADRADRDFWLDLWMAQRVAPALGLEMPAFVFDFPASQAALARVRGDVAERFELFWNGMELANGFHELGDAAEQRARFEADRAGRAQRGRTVPPYDANLIAALAAGLPDCAGVALGLDRLLMCRLGLTELASSLAFADSRA